jgi:hypothetical protein
VVARAIVGEGPAKLEKEYEVGVVSPTGVLDT